MTVSTDSVQSAASPWRAGSTWLYVFIVWLIRAVAERFHDDPRLDALDEQQRRACVAKVMEAHRWQRSSLKEVVEAYLAPGS